MNSSNIIQCLDKPGDCTKGENCSTCNDLSMAFAKTELQELNFNTNANEYIPKSKRNQTNNVFITKETQNNENNKLNLSEKEYTPGNQSKYNKESYMKNSININTNTNSKYSQYNIDKQAEIEDNKRNEFDIIMQDIMNNETVEEMEDDIESDTESVRRSNRRVKLQNDYYYKKLYVLSYKDTNLVVIFPSEKLYFS